MKSCSLLLFLLPAIAGAQVTGQSLYTTHCAVCHGAAAEGGSAPDLTSARWQASVTDAALEQVIAQGKPGTAMPGFAGQLDSGARKSLVAHLRTLGSQGVQPANDLMAPAVNVTAERLLAAASDNTNWLTYSRDYANHRFSPLERINKQNVRLLVPVWSFQTGTPDGLQSTPLLVDGVLYLSTSWNHVFAIDARTGAELWHYRRKLPEKLKYCCGPVNRGVAVLNDSVYLATLDAHLVALDARTGRPKWDVEMGTPEQNLSGTAPPLAVGNKILIGIAGGDFPSRAFIDAYDSQSGKRLWRFYTVPAAGERGADTWLGRSNETGGAATWMNGSYDPELNTVYWGTGNPYPDYDGDFRRGDNLYSDSVVALDAGTGRLKWHYQFTPSDWWDYDGVNEMLLTDIEHQGRTVKVLLHADRNGHFYAIDRTNGRFVYAKPFVRVTWAKGFDDRGRPIVNPAAVPTAEGVPVCPGAAGGKEWNAMAYSPRTRLVYVPVIENCATFYNNGVEAKKRGLPPGPSGFRYIPDKAYGKVMAIRADTGEMAWEARTRTPMGAGMLATAGGLVFTGEAEGNFVAYDADSGSKLWSYQTGSGMRAGAITYELDGRQYVAIASGMAGAIGGYTGAGAPWMKNYRSGSTLFVFALFEPDASSTFHGGTQR